MAELAPARAFNYCNVLFDQPLHFLSPRKSQHTRHLLTSISLPLLVTPPRLPGSTLLMILTSASEAL